MNAEQKVVELKAEIARIQAKRSASSDKDIQEALKFKEDALLLQLKVAEHELTEEQEAVVVEAATEELSIEEIEKSIRLARAHMAGDRKPAARDILERLEKSSPNNIDVLELKADMLLSNKDFTNALPILKKARKIDPKNVNVEKKLAEVAMRTASIGSIDDQLRMGLSDSPFLTEGDMKASPTVATVLSAFIPGSGHLAAGMTKKGVTYLSIWIVVVIVLLFLLRNESNAMKIEHRGFNPSMAIIGFGFVGAMDYLVALFECAAMGKGKAAVKRPVVEHPKPPVDLPFE